MSTLALSLSLQYRQKMPPPPSVDAATLGSHVRAPGALFVGAALAALVFLPAGSVHAGGNGVLRADEVAQWDEDACPLASALGPSTLAAAGATEVEVTKKLVSIRVGGGEPLMFSIREGEDMNAMRDTLLGSCVRAPGILGVSNVRTDLRSAFEATSVPTRRMAVEEAVDALRKQYGELARAVPEAEEACGVTVPILPVAPKAKAGLTDIRTYLSTFGSIDAAINRIADACRVVDRARTLAPDLVTGASTTRRAAREAASTSAARLAEARASLTPRYMDLLEATGLGPAGAPNAWGRLADTVRTGIHTKLAACGQSGQKCETPLDVATCDKLAPAMKDTPKFVDIIVDEEVHAWMGGAAWCETGLGGSACTLVKERVVRRNEAVILAACRSAYLEGEGPALVQAAEARKQRDYDDAMSFFRMFTNASASSSSSGSSSRNCRMVYTCTCLDDGRQMTRTSECPVVDGMGCRRWATEDKRRECD